MDELVCYPKPHYVWCWELNKPVFHNWWHVAVYRFCRM
jgi:hypothetical protein